MATPNEASVTFLGASELNILGTGLIMVLTLMYFPNGIVGTLAQEPPAELLEL